MIDLSIWTFPLSAILAVVYVIALALFWERLRKPLLRSLTPLRASVVMMLLVMLTQVLEGTWSMPLHRSWPFALLLLLVMFVLGATAVGDFRRKVWSTSFLSHAGLLLVLWAGFFGAPDVQDAQMIASKERSAHLAYGKGGEYVLVPFEVQLKDFCVDYYEGSQMPKQYTSTLLVDGEEMKTSVNHPCSHNGWLFYQYDYDHSAHRYSVIKLVRDPWLPFVYLGMAMLVLGAILQVREAWHSKRTLPIILLLTVVFGLLSVARINFGTLMPALRSLWFVPHLIVYMLAYAVLALASILALWQRCTQRANELPKKLLSTASALLLIGMLCGAVWAKEAWGNYWTWDAKECWAAVTWMLTLAGMHLPQRRTALISLFIWLSFIAMQITWYGVNYLPSAHQSLHTYNQ